MSFNKIIFLFSISLFIISCSSYYNISTNTFVDGQALPEGFSKNSSFSILPMQQNNQLFSKEVSQKIEKILKEKGFRIDSPNQADYYLLFNFGMTSSTGTINVPKYIPGGTQTKKGSVYGSEGSAQYQEETQSPGSTIYVPETYTFYTRGILIMVYDADIYRKTKKEEQVWQGFSVSSGQNADLRDVIDYLLVSVFKYFGQNTRKNINTNLKENNEEVKKLRGELSSLIDINQSLINYANFTH